MNAEKRVTVCVCGPSPDGLRRKACCTFDERLGAGCWQLETWKLTAVSRTLGGRPRLYEGRFEAVSPA
jgi:hypothetical protein